MTNAIRCDMIGMNQNLMIDYIHYVSDMVLVMLGYSKLFNTQNPFDFMDTISLFGKDNFFENRPDAYQKAHNAENKDDWEYDVLTEF